MGLAEQDSDNKTISNDATYLKTHRTASSLRLKREAWTPDWADTGRHEHKTACSYRHHCAPSLPLYHLRANQRLHRSSCFDEWLPDAEWLFADRGYDVDWFRDTLIDRGTMPCIIGRKSRKMPIKYDKRRHKRRNQIERMFGRIKDWRRVATRYNRSPTVFLSAIALAATVIF